LNKTIAVLAIINMEVAVDPKIFIMLLKNTIYLKPVSNENKMPDLTGFKTCQVF